MRALFPALMLAQACGTGGLPGADLDAPSSGGPAPGGIVALAEGAPMALVALTGGTFTMGPGPEEREARPWELPRHRVALSPFWIGRSEVTRDQWRAVLGAGGPGVALDGAGDLPVSEVTWCDALIFLNALSRREGLEPA